MTRGPQCGRRPGRGRWRGRAADAGEFQALTYSSTPPYGADALLGKMELSRLKACSPRLPQGAKVTPQEGTSPHERPGRLSFVSCVLAKDTPGSNHQEIPDKPELKGTLQSSWPELLKNVKVKKRRD